MLEIEALEAGYGAKQVLFGLSLAVRAGEVVTLMGRNGMGKTTTVRAIMGMLPARRGRLTFRGVSIGGAPTHRIVKRGIGVVPEGRQIFASLTVLENLQCAHRFAPDSGCSWSVQEIFGLFPRLMERQGNWGWQLSGGEQQMLAIGRALMTAPSMLILDEATEGVAPLIREEIWSCLDRIRRDGISILVIDKNLKRLVRLADRHYLIEKGTIGWQGTSEDLMAHPELHERYLGV